MFCSSIWNAANKVPDPETPKREHLERSNIRLGESLLASEEVRPAYIPWGTHTVCLDVHGLVSLYLPRTLAVW